MSEISSHVSIVMSTEFPFSEHVRKLLLDAINRFVRLRRVTPRHALRQKLKGQGEILDRLLAEHYLIEREQNNYAPGIMAFETCGDDFLLSFAKTGTGIVLHTLQNLYEIETPKTSFSLTEIKQHAAKLYSHPEDQQIELGLSLVAEIDNKVLSGWTPQDGLINVVHVREDIVDFENIEQFWDNAVQERLALRAQKGKEVTIQSVTLQTASVEAKESMTSQGDEQAKGRRIWVVHGRDERLRSSMFTFLRSIGLEPLEFSAARSLTDKPTPYVGEILDVAFAHAQAVVVLLSPDDEARLRPDLVKDHDQPYEKELTGQARPNVLFEGGMAFVSHRNQTLLVQVGNVRPFSDVAGRHIVHLNNSFASRQDLANRLKSAGCPVDLTGTDWHTSGDFSDPSPAAGSTPASIQPASVQVPRPNLTFHSMQVYTLELIGDVWRRTQQPQKNPTFAITMTIGNDPRHSEDVRKAEELKAHLIFSQGNKELRRIVPGSWVDEDFNAIYIPVGDCRELVIAIGHGPNNWFTVKSRRDQDYPPGLSAIETEPMIPMPKDAGGLLEIKLIDSKRGRLLETFYFDWRWEQGYQPYFVGPKQMSQSSS